MRRGWILLRWVSRLIRLIRICRTGVRLIRRRVLVHSARVRLVPGVVRIRRIAVRVTVVDGSGRRAHPGVHGRVRSRSATCRRRPRNIVSTCAGRSFHSRFVSVGRRTMRSVCRLRIGRRGIHVTVLRRSVVGRTRGVVIRRAPDVPGAGSAVRKGVHVAMLRRCLVRCLKTCGPVHGRVAMVRSDHTTVGRG